MCSGISSCMGFSVKPRKQTADLVQENVCVLRTVLSLDLWAVYADLMDAYRRYIGW